ncbi:hypothetical protein E2562_033510 [Oryza meyeriana var. granulata]|uniref:Uncharacterized protein n=1 Tax=Oryza meyeriana var. granulata TaxID=110450 RepID=A0A6G1EC53_9ORYZ|nr:hypothetical protein E2562_033510 [Oryza meyeriana var. granulata]
MGVVAGGDRGVVWGWWLTSRRAVGEYRVHDAFWVRRHVLRTGGCLAVLAYVEQAQGRQESVAEASRLTGDSDGARAWVRACGLAGGIHGEA